MSKLKLLDLNISRGNEKGVENIAIELDDYIEEVPIELLVSPTPSQGNGPAHLSPHRNGEEEEETSFLKRTNQKAFDDASDQLSSHSASAGYLSSEREELSPPLLKELPSRKPNKVGDSEHQQPPSSRLVFKESARRRRSGGETSRDDDAPRSLTSMSDYTSDQLTYKDRLRDHFNSVRERALESLSRPTSRSQSRMKILLASRPSRAEDALKREERDITMALERHQKLRGQWRQLSEEVLRRKTDKEGYDFFTQESEVELRPGQEIVEEPISPDSSIRSADGKVTAADCLGLKEDWDPIVYVLPKVMEEDRERLKDIFFFPSTKKVPIEKKLEEGLQPRFLEDEGLYVGNPGHRPKRMQARLEQRLIRTHDGRKWFGTDGELLAREVPLEFDSQIHCSPDVSDKIQYHYPTLPSMQPRLLDWNVVLDVELISVQFSHHPLFSREHVMAQRLREIWRSYRELRQADLPRRVRGQLKALRRTRDNMEDIEDDRIFKDIREARNKWLAELQLEKQVEERLINCWKDLQRMRDEQSYRNTSVQINIKEKNSISAENWEKDVGKVIAEAKGDAKIEYKWRRMKYKKEKEKMKRDAVIENDDGDSETPVPPPPIDEVALVKEIGDRYKSAIRKPGEADLEIQLGDLGPPTAASNDSREEARRNAVKQQDFIAKLLYNGREVCHSNSESLNQVFTIKFVQRLAVRLLEPPKSLSLELIESGRRTYQIFLPFPEGLATVANTDIESHQFSSSAVVTHNHAGVGCGKEIVPFIGANDGSNKPICLYISGNLQCRIGWAIDADGRILAPPKSFWTTLRKEKGKREVLAKPQMELNKLREWVDQAKLDPNDPDNAALFDWLSASEGKPNTEEGDINELEFCDSSVIQNNPRLRLLRLRDQGEPEFRGSSMIPLVEKLIPPDIFKAYEARIARPVEQEVVLDPLDSHRAWGKRRLEQIRQQVVQQCRLSRQQRRLADIVIEDQVPDFGTLGLTLMRWLQPKRPLRPERKQRKKIPVQSLVGQDVSIVVNVVRAFEVPVRKDVDTLAGNENLEGFSLVNVRPFVSATFRGTTVRTTAAEGANPTWNQDLVLPVRTGSGDFSPGVLAGMRDTLYLHLFDEVVVDLVEEDVLRDSTIHQRLERHWLASLEIPFSTLYCNTRVEGTFQLYSPPVLLGYEREAHRISGAGVLPQRDATYLTLFITLQPALNPPEPFQDLFSSAETPALERHLRGWVAEVSSLFSGRKVRPLVSTVAGSSVCMTRLLRPLQPPDVGIESITPSAAARFVARIPTIASSTLFPGAQDVRLTCDQVLNMLSGDVEDHAVLLCCFFLHMDLPAYLLFGVGIPHGPTVYVIINNPGYESVWDPTTGRKYSVHDSFCPLQKVYCLVNNLNIWANIQEEDSPRRIRFDVSKRGEWLPAFNKNMAAPTDSIQPEELEFKETSKQAVLALQDKLERSLRDGVMRWRRRQRTQWNRYCSATMRKLLPALEESTWEVNEPSSPDHWQGLNDILASHKVCGFPINMAYTNLESIMEAVKATGVHTNESDEVEFALTVYVHSYPSDVLSVWIYVASLIRRR